MTWEQRKKRTIKEYLERTKKIIDCVSENLDEFEYTDEELNSIFRQSFALCGNAGDIKTASEKSDLL